MSQVNAMVNKLLTDVSNKYTITNPISDLVLPLIKVKQSTGLIGSYGYNHIRQENDLMGGKGKARQVDTADRKIDQVYRVTPHGLSDIVTEDDYANVEEPFDAEIDTTESLTSLVLINKEILCRNIMLSSTLIPSFVTLAAADKFSASTSKPLDTFTLAAKTILDNSGAVANACAMSYAVFLYLRKHPDLLRALGYADARPGMLSIEEVKNALGLEYLFVSDAMVNTAKHGQAAVNQQIWGSDLVVYHRAPTAGKNQICLGYQFKKIGKENRLVYRNPIGNPPEATEVIVKDDYGYEIVNGGAGYRILSAI